MMLQFDKESDCTKYAAIIDTLRATTSPGEPVPSDVPMLIVHKTVEPKIEPTSAYTGPPQQLIKEPPYVPTVYPLDKITTYSDYIKVIRQTPQSVPPYNLPVKDPTNWIKNSDGTAYNGRSWQNKPAQQWYDVIDPKIWGCTNLISEWGSPLQVIYDNNSFDYIRSEVDFTSYFKIFKARSSHVESTGTASAFHGKEYMHYSVGSELRWRPTKFRATWEPANLPLMIQGIDNDPYGPKYSGIEYTILPGNQVDGYTATAITGLSIQATDYNTNFTINTIEMYGDDPAQYYQQGTDSICDVNVLIPPGRPTKALFNAITLPHDFYPELVTKIWSIQSLTVDKPINQVYLDTIVGNSIGLELSASGNPIDNRGIRINPNNLYLGYGGDLNFYYGYPMASFDNVQCILTLGTESGRVMRWHMTIA